MQIIPFLMALLSAIVDIADAPSDPTGNSGTGTEVGALENPWGPPPWPKSN